jgi:FixJ family two-component response regulator
MKAGAVEFLQKPFTDQLLLDTVQSALTKYSAIWDQEARREKSNKSLASLTSREREVLGLMRAGKPNKVIASILNISVRTVEGHRATIMSKTGSRSLGELFEMLHSHS